MVGAPQCHLPVMRADSKVAKDVKLLLNQRFESQLFTSMKFIDPKCWEVTLDFAVESTFKCTYLWLQTAMNYKRHTKNGNTSEILLRESISGGKYSAITIKNTPTHLSLFYLSRSSSSYLDRTLLWNIESLLSILL